jgi:hypothetical protein
LIHRPGGCFFNPRCPYARAAHRRVDPRLTPVTGDAGHEVACLLEPQLRTRIWNELQAGRDPEAVRELAGAEGISPAVSDATPLTDTASLAPESGL